MKTISLFNNKEAGRKNDPDLELKCISIGKGKICFADRFRSSMQFINSFTW